MEPLSILAHTLIWAGVILITAGVVSFLFGFITRLFQIQKARNLADKDIEARKNHVDAIRQQDVSKSYISLADFLRDVHLIDESGHRYDCGYGTPDGCDCYALGETMYAWVSKNMHGVIYIPEDKR